MVSTYIKAGIVTLLIILIGVYIIGKVDEGRINGLKSEMDSLSMDMESTELLFLYLQVMGDKNTGEVCPAMEALAEKQGGRVFAMVTELEGAEKNNLLGDYSPLRRSYYLTNLKLFLYLQKSRELCPGKLPEPMLYFYSLGQNSCPDCAVQEAVLNQLGKECEGVRVFAFPNNSDEPLVNALVERYNITKVPSVVVQGNKTLRGLRSLNELKALAACGNATGDQTGSTN